MGAAVDDVVVEVEGAGVAVIAEFGPDKCVAVALNAEFPESTKAGEVVLGAKAGDVFAKARNAVPTAGANPCRLVVAAHQSRGSANAIDTDLVVITLAGCPTDALTIVGAHLVDFAKSAEPTASVAATFPIDALRLAGGNTHAQDAEVEGLALAARASTGVRTTLSVVA